MFELRYPDLVHPNASRYCPGSHSPRNKRDSWHNSSRNSHFQQQYLSFCFTFCEKVQAWRSPNVIHGIILQESFIFSNNLRFRFTFCEKMQSWRSFEYGISRTSCNLIILCPIVLWWLPYMKYQVKQRCISRAFPFTTRCTSERQGKDLEIFSESTCVMQK